MSAARRLMSIDDYLAAAGQSWATAGNIRPGTDHYRAPRDQPVDEDQSNGRHFADEHQDHADPPAAAPLTSGRNPGVFCIDRRGSTTRP